MAESYPPIAHVPTIIAGGRDYEFTRRDIARLDCLPISLVISGGAKGADACGERWAQERGIPVQIMKADWKTHGRAAGPIRNVEMAKVAKAAVIFPGGNGTRHMLTTAKDRGLDVYDFFDPKLVHFEPTPNTKHDGVLSFMEIPVLLPHARHWRELFSETCLYTYDAQHRPTHPIEDVRRHRGHGLKVGTVGAYAAGTGCRVLPHHFSLAVRPTDRLLDLIEAYTIPLQDTTHWRITETVDGGLNVTFSYGQIIGFKFVALFEAKQAREIMDYILSLLKHE